jgi:hypothetical protein
MAQKRELTPTEIKVEWDQLTFLNKKDFKSRLLTEAHFLKELDRIKKAKKPDESGVYIPINYYGHFLNQ